MNRTEIRQTLSKVLSADKPELTDIKLLQENLPENIFMFIDYLLAEERTETRISPAIGDVLYNIVNNK